MPVLVTRAALVSFYKKHDPSKIAAVDFILKRDNHDGLRDGLREKYGEAPAVHRRSGSSKLKLAIGALLVTVFVQFYY